MQRARERDSERNVSIDNLKQIKLTYLCPIAVRGFHFTYDTLVEQQQKNIRNRNGINNNKFAGVHMCAKKKQRVKEADEMGRECSVILVLKLVHNL